ncbi:unnamed protein product [Plutella xylostella]|uniref:(diamondback moth) hypothetical protein n=1 Tax=Plutella xylostella TaxID=51655 RepID=A0A8S4FZY3_PLUXY|nr:unnamed protein product [Plutella xylostella]
MGRKTRKPRRGMMRRAVFSDLQRKGLEKRFQVQKYISKPDRKKLAEKLGLKDSQRVPQITEPYLPQIVESIVNIVTFIYVDNSPVPRGLAGMVGRVLGSYIVRTVRTKKEIG